MDPTLRYTDYNTDLKFVILNPDQNVFTYMVKSSLTSNHHETSHDLNTVKPD